MPNDIASYNNVEDFAQMPDWAKSQARDPKVTRALVSTSSTRSDLLRSLLKPKNLIHCYAKPGYGLDPWLTRFLATLGPEYETIDISKTMQIEKLNSHAEIENFIRTYFDSNSHIVTNTQAQTKANELKKNSHFVVLLRLDRILPPTIRLIIAVLAEFSDAHTLILNSARSPDPWLFESGFDYQILHLGEPMLSYSLEDYEKLTTRWPSKPSHELIKAVMALFDSWPEPCLRTLCEITDHPDKSIEPISQFKTKWLAGHQWISTFVYSLPIDMLQIMLTAHAQPVLTPEGLDLCSSDLSSKPSTENSLNASFYDTRRRVRSQTLTKLCHYLILEQFTHPRLHFRWNSRSVQTVLQRISTEKHQLTSLRLLPPRALSSLTLELCKLYLEHDYIQEIIELCQESNDTAGLEFLISQQPGRVIDYLRGASAHLHQPTASIESLMMLTNQRAATMQAYFQRAFYWSPQEKLTLLNRDEPLDTAGPANQSLAAKPIFDLIDQFDYSRSALATGQLADGLNRLEHIFLSAMDERCFSVAAPSIALIGLIDFFCMNKQHLRKILQSLDHAEPLTDPQTLLSMVDWTDTCVSPLQILSSHGPAITKRLATRTPQDFAGQIPEEAYLFKAWITSLAAIYRGSPKSAEQINTNALTRLMTHYRKIQEQQKQNKFAAHTEQQEKVITTDCATTSLHLLRPWILSFIFIKLLNNLQIIGKPTAREAQNLLKQYEPYFLMVQSSTDRKDIWHILMQIILLFLKSMHNPNLDTISQLEKEVTEAKALDLRLVWIFGTFLLSAALWNGEQEEDSLDHFYTGIEFAQSNGLQDILTPFIDLLHPQIRRAKQKNKAILLITRALDKINRKNHLKNNRLEQLSKRELEILSFINQGMSNEDIAEHLCRAKGTVKLHVHNIYKKLEIRNRVEAIQVYNQYTKSNEPA